MTSADSIQVAIDAAVDGDRVLVDPGTYFETLDFHGKAIQVIGVGGAALTTLDANGGGTAVRFVSGEGVTSRLAGFSITGGSSSGIATSPGVTPTVENCEIYGNVGLWGGGVHGDALLLRCTIRNNHAATGNGGGVWGTPFMEDCIVRDNSLSSGAGGGVYVQNGSAVLRNCMIRDNRAVFGQGRGGGVYVNSPAEALIERCTVSGNLGSAGNVGAYGGGIYVEAAGTTIVNCTILDNTLSGSSEAGGGVYGPAQLRNSIVRGNTSSQLSNLASVTYCDVQGGAAGAGNFDADPLFVDVAGGDDHLLLGSPCIDAGDPLDALDANGSRVDVGSLPFDLPAPTTYCLGLPNSEGAGARIAWSGTQSLAANDFLLEVSGVPAGRPGLFFYGAVRSQEPFRDGLLCVDASNHGLHRVRPVVFADGFGNGSRALDVTVLPASAGPGAILPGSTWNFQFWYRDPLGAGNGSNTSNALSVPFVL